ncbi:hypothetical protein GDO81_000011 [Engystomops pustulosus]|uniref:G-protein coupled receptors family 3 profile domain-containing protein n=1 Tax=Engystomops pustulosus TaxID=76066 RepID=A0AAV7D101_ENGPU|nr:hypothetical protein GDO81_000011 [Engystomops pustulosus]
MAVTKLLHHFGWTWVGILVTDDDAGEKELQVLIKYMEEYGICVAFTMKLKKPIPNKYNRIPDIIKNSGVTRNFQVAKIKSMNKKVQETISRSSTSIIIVCGTFSFFMIKMFQLPDHVVNMKTFLLPPHWFINSEILHYCFTALNCSLGFQFATSEVNPYNQEAMTQFFLNVHPFNYPDDKWLEEFWILNFRCLSPNDDKNQLFENLLNIKLRNCSGKENFTNFNPILNPEGCSITYDAIITLVYALHAMFSALGREAVLKDPKNPKCRYKLNRYLKELEYGDSELEKTRYYDERGALKTIFNIYNWISMYNNNFSIYKYVGSYTPWAQPDEKLFIETTKIQWKSKKTPRSQCSENCPRGSRKMKDSKKPICCYDCVLCPEGEISNMTALSSIAVIFWTISVLIFGIYVSHKNTPVVKANNKNLSFILLISLSMCFLCVFLFIGRPVDRTCKLRQIVFGVIFSVCLSSVFAKTIMVYMAFKISRPGSPWKKLIAIKVSNSIVVLASTIEVIISVVWLYFSPPYLEQDTQSYQRKVVIQCNEGSQVGFFALLGYLFLLASISFIVAYLARTLPDRFNEAKYITFSMLVFCSVWITMVPTYLSTKGKNMVAVEIFSILASSAGLLSFIFFPKCYIILIKPQMKQKIYIHRATN